MFPRRPAVPADLSASTAEQLDAFETLLRGFADEARSVESATADDIAEVRSAASDLGRVRDARSALSAASAQLASEAAAAFAAFDADNATPEAADADADAPAEETAPETAPEADPVTAPVVIEPSELSRPAATFSPRALPRSVRPDSAATAATNSDVNEWTYTGAVRGVRVGEKVESLSQLASVIARTRNGFSGTRQPLLTRRHNFAADTPVWSAASKQSDQSVLNGLALDKAARVTNRMVDANRALLAAGNSCSLFTPDYMITRYAQKRTPLLDSGTITVVDAPRGGISWMKPRSYRTYAKAINDMPNADMCDPAASPKTFIRLDCETEDECEVDASYWFVRLCNLRTKTAAEQIEAALADIEVLFAEHRERLIMDVLNATATPVTFTSPYGTEPTILNALLLAATSMRKRLGMARDAMLDLHIEDHVLDALCLDIHALGYAPRLWAQGATAPVVAYLVNELHLRPVFLSTSFTASQYETWSSAVQAPAAPLNPLPETINAFISPPGSYVHPMTQEINFDMYRDSTLNRSNEVELGYEVFENTCFKGLEAIHIEIPNCPSGSRADLVKPDCSSLVGAY